MSKYDSIVEIEKNIDEITEVQKFNPFHDSRGRFSNKNGFSTYSANPKSRAGALAITRSAQAGHGTTFNSHKESQGENINQNYSWLNGGPGAKTLGAQGQLASQQQGVTTNGGKKPTAAATKPQPQQQQTKPTQTNPKNQGGSLAQDYSDVTVSSGNKLAIVQRDVSGHPTSGKKIAGDNYQERVAGKDISNSFDATKIKGNKSAIDKVAEQQGWNKPSTVTNDLDAFQKAAIKSGRVMFRSVDGNGKETADQICKKTMLDGNASLGGNGGKAYGGGMYVTDCKLTTAATGSSINAKNLAMSSGESYAYANTQMMATVRPDAKIATAKQANALNNAFYSLSAKQRAKFGYDIGAYIASKGYDGAKWHDDSDPAAYTTVYNKSALIFYGEVSQAY